jgi:chromosomal replication initiation ATPase DnaA
VLSYFGNKGKRGYREFIVEGMKNGITTPWENVRGQVVIGAQEFVEDVVQNHLRGSENKRGEESQIRQLTGMKSGRIMREAEGYFGITRGEIRSREQRYTDARYVTSYLLRRHCLMTLQAIGTVVGLHYSAVGNAIRQVRDRPTESQAKYLRELERKIKN